MKKSSPISLFSFQDIITSLTGIMIVIVLVILLQIVESAEIAVNEARQDPESVKLIRKKEELLKAKADLAKQLDAMSRFNQPFSELSEIELKRRIEEKTKILNAEKDKIRNLEEILKKELEKQRSLTSKEESLQKEVQKFKKENKLYALELKNHQLNAEINRLKSEIAAKQKRLDIQIAASSTQSPLVIECFSWGFRMKLWPSGSLVTIGAPGERIDQSKIDQLARHIKNRPEKSFFIVLLLRKNAYPLMKDIIVTLKSTEKEIEFGKELITEDEDCLS